MSEQSTADRLAEQRRLATCVIEGDPFCDALHECVAMYEHVRDSDKAVPPELVENLRHRLKEAEEGTQIDVVNMMEIHNRFSDMIKPARPYSVAYIYDQKGQMRKLRFLGPIPIIRRMVVVSVIALIVFVLAKSLAATSSLTWLTDNKQFLDAITLMSAAAVGACFSNLFRAYKYVSASMFDPKLDMTYWIRLILGVTAGYILAEVLSDFIIGSPVGNGSGSAQVSGLTKPLLAILGGFSASAVYAILERLVQAVESIVRGDVTAMVQSREAEIRSRLEREMTQRRVNMAKEMMEARARLKETGDTGAIDAELDKLIKNALSSS